MAEATLPPCHITGTALITGGASGMGKAIAHTFAQNGITNLSLIDLSLTNLQTTQKELNEKYPNVRTEIHSVDVSNEEQISAVIQSTAGSFGRIDISVHAAGIGGPISPTHDLDIKEWQRVIDVDQTGIMLCDKWVVRQMLGQEVRPGYEGRGRIVNIASVFGVMTPAPRMGMAAYIAAKHAVIGLTKIDAKTYARDGIRINAVCPGIVDTPLVRPVLEAGVLDPELEKLPIARAADPEEIAHTVLFLVSRMGSYMCGATLVVDGGWVS